MINAKVNGKTSVKIIAGTSVATFTKYENQLNLPMRYAKKEITKVCFADALNEIIKTGTGASHNKYQKSPLRPLAKYQHIPDKIIAVGIKPL